jgi:hypothetical protein
MKVLLVYTILISIGALFLLIKLIIRKISIRKDNKKIYLQVNTQEKDTLSFCVQYTDYGSYSVTEKIKSINLNETLLKFRQNNSNSSNIVIESKFNNINYPFFDLDTDENYNLFKKLYSTESYVIFKSSSDNYWGILDKSCNTLSEIFKDHNWKICNDKKYTYLCVKKKRIIMRGMYENKNRKPTLYETNGQLSENFKNFIDKILYYYNNEGFELSILRYEDKEMLIQFNRKLKLKQLNKNDNI